MFAFNEHHVRYNLHTVYIVIATDWVSSYNGTILKVSLHNPRTNKTFWQHLTTPAGWSTHLAHNVMVNSFGCLLLNYNKQYSAVYSTHSTHTNLVDVCCQWNLLSSY